MNKHNITLHKQVEVYDSVDVIIVGGGPSGIAAAISASRCGQKTILLEHSGQLGGMGTLGNVSVFMGIGNVTGIYREIIAEFLPAALPSDHHQSIWPQYSPFAFRHFLNEKLEQEAVAVFYHTSFITTIMNDQQVTGVIANTREGLRAFHAKVVIDCTGDARVAQEAGVPIHSGREEDGLTQPMTLMFMMQDTGKPVQPYLPENCYYYEKVEDLPQGRLLHWNGTGDGSLLVNMTRVKGNGAKIEDINFAEKESLRQVFSVAHFLQRTTHPTYVLSHVPGQVGVRETNQIIGHYTLTEQDLLNSCKFEDVVAQTDYEIDIHNPTGGANTDERKLQSYDIPYRCMLPEAIQGLIVAGRCISASHVAMSSMRVQATCFALGQAAGIAASIANDDHVSVDQISISKLHEQMVKQGVKFIK